MDKLIITLMGGKGGNGTLGKIKKNKKIFFTGGDGGKGGDIYIKSDKNIHNFNHLKLKKNYKANNGYNGKKNGCAGKKGLDIILKVPVYTKIYYINTKIKFFEFLIHNQQKLCVIGGVEGKGGKHFQGKNKSVFGKKGEKQTFLLKLIIKNDIVIIGTPFSGKTTLLTNILYNQFIKLYKNIFWWYIYKNHVLKKINFINIFEVSYFINKYLFIQKEYLLKSLNNTKILILVLDITKINYFIYNLSNFLHYINNHINNEKLIVLFNKINLIFNINKVKNIMLYIKNFKINCFFINLNNTFHNYFIIKQINIFKL